MKGIGLKGGKIHSVDLNTGVSINEDVLLCHHFFIFLILSTHKAPDFFINHFTMGIKL